MTGTFSLKLLGDIVNDGGFISDGDWIESKDQDPKGDVRLIQLADIGDGNYINKSKRFLTSETVKRLRCTPLIVDDILVARMPDPIGRACLFPGDNKHAITVVDVCILRVDTTKTEPSWLKNAINAGFIRKEIERAAGGTTRTRISRSSLEKLAIPTPAFIEQQKIAAILTAVDDKLDVITRQIAATQTLKQGLTQTLFSRGVGTQDSSGQWVLHKLFSKKLSATSLPTSWKLTPFGEIAPIIRRPVEIEADAFYPELGMRSFGKGTFHKPAISGIEVGNKRLFKIHVGDLMFSNVFAWEGSVAIAKKEDDGRYGSHRYITCKVDNTRANTLFLYRYITTPAGIEQLKLASPGGAGRNRTLGLSALAAIKIPLPPLDEQNRITEILDSVDAKLGLLITKQTHYQTLKRGLMQKLLTGEWRVNVDAVTEEQA
jgi:type I restriction enzyme S subunit